MLLHICIPTYKRRKTLIRCIESVVSQIEHYNLHNQVNIYVADDASPDDTLDAIKKFSSLPYFSAATRKENLGMNVNIKTMFQEVCNASEYQLIITDDDYLQADTLDDIVNFLEIFQHDHKTCAAVWTPRHSYTEDNALNCIVCNPFSKNVYITSSDYNVGNYMANGFILSGLILRSRSINFEFWNDSYTKNAYFPIIFFGELLQQNGAYFWNKNIVYHTVLNECHWERWGENDIVIKFRLFSDYINAHGVLASNINGFFNVMKFYFAAFNAISRQVNNLVDVDKWSDNKNLLANAISISKTNGAFNFIMPLKLSMFFGLFNNTCVSVTKLVIFSCLTLLVRDKKNQKKYRTRRRIHAIKLKFFPIVLKIILFFGSRKSNSY